MLSMLMDYGNDAPYYASLMRRMEQEKGTILEVGRLSALGHYRDLFITHSELEEAFSYLEDNISEKGI